MNIILLLVKNMSVFKNAKEIMTVNMEKFVALVVNVCIPVVHLEIAHKAIVISNLGYHY